MLWNQQSFRQLDQIWVSERENWWALLAARKGGPVEVSAFKSGLPVYITHICLATAAV